jgi:hypothetical protein
MVPYAQCRSVGVYRCEGRELVADVRLANPEFARLTIEAGVSSFEIALFGATAERRVAFGSTE